MSRSARQGLRTLKPEEPGAWAGHRGASEEQRAPGNRQQCLTVAGHRGALSPVTSGRISKALPEPWE